MSRKVNSTEGKNKTFVKIRSQTQKKAATFNTWKYWEIAGELIWRHADRVEAYDTAKWCAFMAKPGERKELAPDITLEVLEA